MAASPEFESAGIVVEGRPVTTNRAINAFSILVPAFGSLMIPLDWPRMAPSGTTLAIFAAFFVLEVLGIGIGLHRYFTHRAFQTGPGLRAILAVLGSSAWQGPIDRWVADHRRHHRFTDQPLDPHSPHWMNGHRPRWKWLGLVNAHVFWLFYCPLTDPERYAADIRRDPISRWCSRHYLSLAVASVLAPSAVGFALGGPHEAMLFGEGFHSYHHAHPTAAVNEPASLDIGGFVLRGLERVGLVWGLKGRPGEGAS